MTRIFADLIRAHPPDPRHLRSIFSVNQKLVEISMNSFPAIAIGGPPHSGKSVLTYLLTQALRTQKVEHYVLRACPDGEGDWSQEAPPATVQLLRYKGAFSAAFVDRICRDLERRHLPLLVDAGGKPTGDQERIFDFCTHAVLIAHDDAGLAAWRELAARHGLAVVAELYSARTGQDEILATTPVLRGQIANLERHTATPGIAVAALAARLGEVLAYEDAELRQHHLQHAPTELAVDLDQLGDWLGLPRTERRWQPVALPAAVAYLPNAPISLYARAPQWLYAALALHIAPRPVFLFDVRLGWIEPVALACAASPHIPPISWQIEQTRGYTFMDLRLAEAYLDYADFTDATLPPLPTDRGVVLSGKLPNWLLVGAALAYRTHPWLAIFQPQFSHAEAIVIFSRTQTHSVGATTRLTHRLPS
jgi:CRISPR-associated protein Csx3